MPGRRTQTTSRHEGLVARGPLALAILVLLALVIGAAVLDVPPALWSRPGWADLRGDILGTLGLPTPQPTAPPAQAGAEGWYQVYFTSPRYPDRESDHQHGIDEHLVRLIAAAQRSVDVAAYELNLDSVADAMLAARERGVAVRLVTDTDNLEEEAVRRLEQGGVPVVDDRRGAIMHNKFVVIDGQLVWTGSWNPTVNCTYRNNNNAIAIESVALARNYEAEFAEMFEESRFGPRSPSRTPYPQVTIEGTRIESYFAPEDQVAGHLMNTVSQAQESIHFLAFSFTDSELAQLLIERAEAGLSVSGVVEKRGAESEYSQFGALRRAGIDVLVDGNPYIMHHKVLIIDEAIVVTGSFNFSQSANEANDENVLIIHNPDVARLYLEEFQRMRQQALEAAHR